jgi:predicted CopG family antitoxin
VQKTVNAVLDDAYFTLIKEKLPYLGYESLDDLVKDAVQLRVEDLLRLIALSQSSP